MSLVVVLAVSQVNTFTNVSYVAQHTLQKTVPVFVQVHRLRRVITGARYATSGSGCRDT